MIDPTEWLGRRDVAEDVCALPLARRLAALLDRDPAALREGDALPQGWHMILFTSEAGQSSLGADGHPSAGGMLAPPQTLPRRMLGGRRTRFAGLLRIGAAMRRVSEISRFEGKQGRSGRLAVATVRHAIVPADETDPAVIEEQDVIYREAATGPDPVSRMETPDSERPPPSRRRDFTPDPALLFRYSAVTFNAHRIHYDAAYATGQEGYPGLVVNGGLTALLLLEMAKDAARRPLRQVDLRNRRPLICGRPACLCIAPDRDGWMLWAQDDQGRTALEATAT